MNSLPLFPQFRRLTLEDKSTFENLTKKLNYHHCDMNFFGMWIWDTEEKLEISTLHENIILKFQDYETKKTYYSFLGKNKVLQTIEVINQDLKLIPEEFIADVKDELEEKYKIEEDRDYFDYVYSIEKLAKLEGGEYHKQRNMIKKFVTDNPKVSIRLIDVGSKVIQEEIFDLIKKWQEEKGIDDSKVAREFEAIRRQSEFYDAQQILALGVYTEKKLIAFSTNGLTHDNWVMTYFRKADRNYHGIYEYLEQKTAQELLKLGYKFLNYEYDMGIAGLRQVKELWRPIKFLKKVTICPRVLYKP